MQRPSGLEHDEFTSRCFALVRPPSASSSPRHCPAARVPLELPWQVRFVLSMTMRAPPRLSFPWRRWCPGRESHCHRACAPRAVERKRDGLGHGGIVPPREACRYDLARSAVPSHREQSLQDCDLPLVPLVRAAASCALQAALAGVRVMLIDLPDVAACPVCGTEARPLFQKHGIPHYRCGGCRLVFARPATNANFETTLDAYDPAYRRYLEPSPEDDVNHAYLLAWVARFRPVSGRALDVGSGSGKFVRFLRRCGVEAIGLEPARVLYDTFMAGEPGFSAETIETFAARHDGRFSLIFACDVIEHVERPDQFLAGAARLLEPGGVIIVTTPDVSSFFARLFGKHWHYFHRYHLSLLSRKTIGRIAAAQGLREIGFARHPRKKSVGYLLQYLLNYGLSVRGARVLEYFQRFYVSINLRDTMALAFQTGPP